MIDKKCASRFSMIICNFDKVGFRRALGVEGPLFKVILHIYLYLLPICIINI